MGLFKDAFGWFAGIDKKPIDQLGEQELAGKLASIANLRGILKAERAAAEGELAKIVPAGESAETSPRSRDLAKRLAAVLEKQVETLTSAEVLLVKMDSAIDQIKTLKAFCDDFKGIAPLPEGLNVEECFEQVHSIVAGINARKELLDRIIQSGEPGDATAAADGDADTAAADGEPPSPAPRENPPEELSPDVLGKVLADLRKAIAKYESDAVEAEKQALALRAKAFNPETPASERTTLMLKAFEQNKAAQQKAGFAMVFIKQYDAFTSLETTMKIARGMERAGFLPKASGEIDWQKATEEMQAEIAELAAMCDRLNESQAFPQP